MLSWILVSLFAGTSLIIIPDVNNSTLFKPFIVYFFSAALLASILHRIFSQQQIAFKFNLLHLASILYVIVLAVALFNAHNLRLGIEALLLQTCFLIVFLSSSLVTASESETKILRYGAFLTILITFIAGSIQALQIIPAGITILGSGREVISTLGNATYFAGYLLLIIPVLLGVLLNKNHSPFAQSVVAVLLLVALFLLLKTESRSAWLAAFIGITLFVLLNFTSSKYRLIGVAVVLLSVIAGYFLFPELFQKRIANMFDLNPQSSFARRLYFYEGAWKAFLASPLIGHGLGNFTVFLPKFRSPDYWMYQSEDIVPHAHNEFLEILSETGILGLSAFLFVVIIFITRTIKHTNNTANPNRTLYIGFLCAVISVLIDNLFSLNLRTVPVAVGFWMILGLSQGESAPQLQRVISLPPFLSKLRWLPFIALLAFCWWLIPQTIAGYKTERKILEGNILTWKNDERNAGEKYKEALSYDSASYLARYQFAASSLKQMHYEEARTHAMRLIQEYPHSPKTHLIVALASFELGDTTQAFEAIRKEIEIENSPQPYYYYAYFANRTGDSSLEFDLLEMMLKQNIKGKSPDFATMGIERLAMLCNNVNRERCVTLFQQLTDTFSGDATVVITLAESFYSLNEFTKSQDVLELFNMIQTGNAQLRNRMENLKMRLQSNQPPS